MTDRKFFLSIFCFFFPPLDSGDDGSPCLTEVGRTDDTAAVTDMRWRPDASQLITTTATGFAECWTIGDQYELQRAQRLAVVDNQLALSLDLSTVVQKR